MEDRSEIFSGKRAVVTGSSKGIGLEVARTLAAAGADVVLHGGHCASSLESAVEALHEQGASAQGVLADLSRQEGIDHLLASVAKTGGVADIWVNNAGADILTGPLSEEGYYRKLEQLWKVDVVAAMQLSRTIGFDMKATGRGCIVNIGWDQVDWGMGGDSGEIFGAIKGAVMGFTRALAKTLAPLVRVNCVAPGWIKTKWGETASDSWQSRAIHESLLQRWGTPADVANVISFLVGSEAGFVTGQTIAVNGGRSQRSSS